MLSVEWEWLDPWAGSSQTVWGVGGIAGPCLSAKNNDRAGGDWHSEPSEEAMEEGEDERGRMGTLDVWGEDRRMWGFGHTGVELVSGDWVGGLERDWQVARQFCGSNALKIQSVPHPHTAAAKPPITNDTPVVVSAKSRAWYGHSQVNK